MNKSYSIKELASALAVAQGKIKGALKDSSNPFFKSKYADLASVVEAIRQPLSENGLSYVQLTVPSEKEEVQIETILMHSSGEWISAIIALPVAKADAQGFGSAMTYARRYGLSAMVGVAPEDDDGNAAAAAKPLGVVAAIHNAKVTPTDGARERLTPERLKEVEKVASNVVDCAEVMQFDTAYEIIEEAKFDADEKVALWTYLGSGIRSALKKESAKRQEAQAATQP